MRQWEWSSKTAYHDPTKFLVNHVVIVALVSVVCKLDPNSCCNVVVWGHESRSFSDACLTFIGKDNNGSTVSTISTTPARTESLTAALRNEGATRVIGPARHAAVTRLPQCAHWTSLFLAANCGQVQIFRNLKLNTAP
eukprot:4534334-Amphidinium_carterae.1